MLFDSPVFFVFLAVVLPVWWLLPLRAGRGWLLLASLVFYGWWSLGFLGLLLATTTLDWWLTRQMDGAPDRRRAQLLTVSVVSNLGTLAAFKYLGFFSTQLNAGLAALDIPRAVPVLELVLPVGISFYTFQAIGYAVDVYRRELPPVRGYLDFLLFITFFPHMVAGPIQRSALLLPQLTHPRRPTGLQVSEAAWLLTWGLFKKDVIADNLAPVVAAAYEGRIPPSGLTVVVAAYAFTWQIYCDFSGYSDIARGLGKLFGVELLENFRRPFFAASPHELWHRWHVSLSQWLRDYLYIPLGGNRVRPSVNLLVTMVLGGFWHGAAWTYVLWGAWHGAWLAVGRRVRIPALPRAMGILATFHITVAGFFLFRAHSGAQALELLSRVTAGLHPAPGDVGRLTLVAVLAAAVLLVELPQERFGDTFVTLRLPRPLQAGVIAVLVAGLALLGSTYDVQFIYFQF